MQQGATLTAFECPPYVSLPFTSPALILKKHTTMSRALSPRQFHSFQSAKMKDMIYNPAHYAGAFIRTLTLLPLSGRDVRWLCFFNGGRVARTQQTN